MSTDTTDTTAVEPDSTVADETAVTDTETTDTADETAQAGLEDDSDVDEDQDDDAGDGKGGREAAKYRRRLRDAEAERDTLAERVDALQRAEVDRLAMADGLKPAALWSGTELAGLLADDGTVDVSKVAEAIAATREQLGIPKPPAGNYVKGEGRTIRRPGQPTGKSAMVSAVMGRDALDG